MERGRAVYVAAAVADEVHDPDTPSDGGHGGYVEAEEHAAGGGDAGDEVGRVFAGGVSGGGEGVEVRTWELCHDGLW